jgi:hypothetical protein
MRGTETRANTDGHGLGLALARHVARLTAGTCAASRRRRRTCASRSSCLPGRRGADAMARPCPAARSHGHPPHDRQRRRRRPHPMRRSRSTRPWRWHASRIRLWRRRDFADRWTRLGSPSPGSVPIRSCATSGPRRRHVMR